MTKRNNLKKNIYTLIFFVFALFLFLQILNFFNAPLAFAKLREGFDAFFSVWNNQSYYQKYLDEKAKISKLESQLNSEQIEKAKSEQKEANCLKEKKCFEFEIIQLFDFVSPDKIIIRGTDEIQIGAIVADKENLIGEVISSKGNNVYEVSTIFNSQKKYTIKNLAKSNIGYSQFIDSSLKIKPLSSKDTFENDEIIVVQEYNSKIYPENLILGKIKVIKSENFVENFLNFHLISKVEVYP